MLYFQAPVFLIKRELASRVILVTTCHSRECLPFGYLHLFARPAFTNGPHYGVYV